MCACLFSVSDPHTHTSKYLLKQKDLFSYVQNERETFFCLTLSPCFELKLNLTLYGCALWIGIKIKFMLQIKVQTMKTMVHFTAIVLDVFGPLVSIVVVHAIGYYYTKLYIKWLDIPFISIDFQFNFSLRLSVYFVVSYIHNNGTPFIMTTQTIFVVRLCVYVCGSVCVSFVQIDKEPYRISSIIIYNRKSNNFENANYFP